jgi:phage-related tail protein
MNAEKELKHITMQLKERREKTDEVIKKIDEDFQEQVNEISSIFSKKYNINILNIYKSQAQDIYKVQISFEKEPPFLNKLKKEIFYLTTGGKQTTAKFGDVMLYWMNFEGVSS